MVPTNRNARPPPAPIPSPVYQALLTRKYLTSKIMPLLAALAVLLCTAMVLITWSVMGGFLSMLLESGRKMVGDVSITWPNTGFAHYDDLIRRLEADPAIDAACPMIETFAVLVLPDDRVSMISLRGIHGPSYSRVIDYESMLWWRPITRQNALSGAAPGEDLRADPADADILGRVLEGGRRLAQYNPASGEWTPGVVLGIEVTDYNKRLPSGAYVPHYPLQPQADGSTRVISQFMPISGTVTLHLLPLDSKGRGIEIVTRSLPVANEFKTGVFDVDRQTAFIELATLQRLMGLEQAQRIADPENHNPFEVSRDPVTGEMVWPEPETVVDPARVTTVLIRAANPATPSTEIQRRARAIYEQFAAAHPDQVPSPGQILINTWEDQNRTIVAAVQKETALVLFIFGFISLTAVFLVLAIFWSMIAEKTRDIGVLRALGASRLGVAWLWMRYGLAIGVVGALLGGAAAYAIVKNINPIHDWLGQALGLSIWDPAVYYFTVIPARVDPVHAAFVLAAGILSSLLGALIPAWRAARLDPVKALRFE